jgi:alginate O-acetyltransferase complex protein AlgI
MLFCSLTFLLFFTVVFIAYWSMPWARARVYLLLVASFIFYATWNHWLAFLICVSTFMDYVVARGMEASHSQARRRLLLTLSLVANLGLLVYFKYANFFLDSLGQFLHLLGASTSMPVLQVILPIGISFYTFEAINYTVDVYRGQVKAERNLAHFMLFITFFPHLVAGPIVRARDFLPQVRRRKRWNWLRVQVGVQFILLGMIKKMAFADHLALYVDPVFAHPENFSTVAAWWATLAYALQIYCDFSGYSDLALGTAHLLGYRLARNFNIPYAAANVAEFWHRWHMSLSTWLRDYLFIPLGGSRNGNWQTARNLMLTMTLGGLWHGANWTFVVWGLVHGALLVTQRIWREFCKARPALDASLRTIPGRILCVAVTFLCVTLCWVLFRATTFAAAGMMFNRLLVPQIGQAAPLTGFSLAAIFAVMALCHLIAWFGGWERLQRRLPAPVLGVSYALLLVITLVLTPGSSQTFIYFQF